MRMFRASTIWRAMYHLPLLVCMTVVDDKCISARDGAHPCENAALAIFTFRDVTSAVGLLPDVSGIRGHGAAWGDVDGDGWIDLYVATFRTDGSKPNLFFRNKNGIFRLDDQESLRLSTRATGVVFADLDNDGDLDLYVGSMPAPVGSRLAMQLGQPLSGCSLLRNESGTFTNISQDNAACPLEFGGRSVAVFDFDGDGLLDLLVGEDPYPGYNGSTTHSTRLFRNRGNLQFEDVTQQAGIPADIPGLGVAAGDVNNDGWPDLFIACHGDGNRLFVNDGQGRYREAPDSPQLFRWEAAGQEGGDNMICGVALGDVNRDGLPDIVLGQHYSRPWLKPVPNRLYLNRGIKEGMPYFEDVTEQVGLVPLPMKAPHVEIQDFDNDGWPDLYASLVTFAGEQVHPLIFRNCGVQNGLPRFRQTTFGVNDFPNDEDRAVREVGAFFDKMIRDRKVLYTAPGPSCDYDNDGRLDLFLPNWWIEAPSLLLRNETPSGNWLQVQIDLRDGGTPAAPNKKVNRMGIGARINVYQAGKLGNAAGWLGCREMSVGFGYASGQPAIAHFGLGTVSVVDLEIVLPHGRGTITRQQVKTNQRIVVTP